MPYPLDVTAPRLGAEAFADNDAASQLAQAAFLLLLGQELRRSRERWAIPRRAAPEEAPDEDVIRFGIPRIDAEGRRYRRRDALPREKLRSRSRARDATELYELSRDLADQL